MTIPFTIHMPFFGFTQDQEPLLYIHCGEKHAHYLIGRLDAVRGVADDLFRMSNSVSVLARNLWAGLAAVDHSSG